jgi:LysR family glycine cleavage system transcriptional activator
MSQDDHSPVFRRLPPLNALRAFEAAARHLSITDAAKELAVTAGAVSQHIKLLEDHAGGALFVRTGRTVVLTELGAELYPILRAGFEQIERASDLIYRPANRLSLRVTAPPTFAAKWLAPRLMRFTSAHPDMEVWISADPQLADIAGGRVDVAIRYGRGRYPDLSAQHLLAADVIPVCSPLLLTGDDPLKTAGDLARQTLIHTKTGDLEEPYPDWAQWLKARGLGAIADSVGLRVDQFALAIEMAAYGRGVALAPRAFVAADLARGRLVAPFADGVLSTELAYYVLTRRNASESTRKFLRWLMDEAARPDEWGDDL